MVDTALAPHTLSLLRRHGVSFVGALLVAFAVAETARLPGIRFVPQVNIIVGWLLFQVLGFGWKDGHLPGPRRLVQVGLASWMLAATLVAFGPWPLAMVSVPGARFANTWPPSLALLAYGLGACCFAIAAAPAVDRVLCRRRRLWSGVVAANTVTMTSYLWHFTALAIAVFGLSKVDMLTSEAVGTSAWWLAKIPMISLAAVVLIGFVMVLSPKERRGLVAISPGSAAPATRGGGTTLLLAIVLAASFEGWTASAGNLYLAVPGMCVMLCVHTILTRTSTSR